jgi:transcriptional regulator with XRE-family HTH domain
MAGAGSAGIRAGAVVGALMDTSERDREIHAKRAAGVTLTVLAVRYGISKQRVSKIARRVPAPEVPLTPALCRRLRREAGLTQVQLAAATGLHAASIGFYERGRCAMRPGNLARIVAALGPPAEPPGLTPALCRAARGLLDWTQKDLADTVGVSVTTITGYERHGATMRPETLARIVAVFRDAGVVIEPADGRTGVWMAHPS